MHIYNYDADYYNIQQIDHFGIIKIRKNDKMLELVNVRHGAVLNRNDGTEGADALEFRVEGIAEPGAEVRVNGQETERVDRQFAATVRLTQEINQIEVAADDNYGKIIRQLAVIWDRNSFRRYNFFFDDCSFFLTEIAKVRPRSLFDHFFLKRLREIHRKFGSKFTLNLFYHDDHHDFSIRDFPGIYRQEFMDNREWLRLSFHAYSEFPDRPYQNATAEKLAADYDLIKGEIERFAGPEVFIAPCVIHWAMTNPANLTVLKERGVNSLSGAYIGGRTRIGESHSVPVTDIGYHCEQDVARYIDARKVYYHAGLGMYFYKSVFCANYFPMEQIENHLQAQFNNPVYNETLGLLTHEQYSYPDYASYLPDHLDRIELACRLATEAGYKPVFFAEGLLGNCSWK